jgi:hypothetical protein
MMSGNVEVIAPAALDLSASNSHISLLAAAYPGWRFENTAAP